MVFFVGLVVCGASMAGALPRFSARTGMKCQSCHVDPSGGGMRQAFGAQYGREELPVPEWSEGLETEDVTTFLTNALGVGADFRTLYMVRQIPDSTGTSAHSENSFWQMQGDLYLNFRITKKVALYLKKGLYSGFEAFGLLRVLPLNGHVKVGKFIPNYGLKMDDHTTFIRTWTGFSPATGRPELTGVEAGVSPGPAQITAGVFNATDAFGGGDSRKAFLGRAEGLFSLGKEVSLSVGANVFRRETQDGGTQTLYGSFGAFSAGDLTFLGEVDMIRSTVASKTVSGVVGFGEVDYMITPGVDLKAMYDFYDPDLDLKSGSVSRYSFGFEFFPLSGVEVRPLYRIVVEDPRDVKDNEFHVLFHVYL
jgi:hypothetical protein